MKIGRAFRKYNFTPGSAERRVGTVMYIREYMSRVLFRFVWPKAI